MHLFRLQVYEHSIAENITALIEKIQGGASKYFKRPNGQLRLWVSHETLPTLVTYMTFSIQTTLTSWLPALLQERTLSPALLSSSMWLP